MNLELLRFIIGTVVLAAGLLTFAMEVFGSYRFEFVLNRMHAAALGDTLGIGISLTGLIIISGLNFTSLKMLLVIMFLWFASPVSSHLISRLEVMTDETLKEHCELDYEEDDRLDREEKGELYADIYLPADGLSGSMCCFGELLQEPAEFHFDFHVLQSGYVDHMDSSGIPGSGNYGSGCGGRGYQRAFLCDAEKDPCYPEGGRRR